MKAFYTYVAALIVATSFLAQPVEAQTPIIFQPGPGLNDGTDEGSENGGKDAYMSDADNIAHGTEGTFYILPISTCNSTSYVSLFQFDVSTLPDAVDSVMLVLSHNNPGTYCYSNCVADFHLAVLTEPWSETTVTFSERPAKESIPFYSLLNQSWDDTLGVKEYDITQTYRNWVNETIPNYGFEYYSSTVGCNNAAVTLYGATSDDTINSGANRPYLKIYASVTGIKSDLSNQISVRCYPNPATDQANLEFTTTVAQNITVELLDVTGKLIYSHEYTSAVGINKISLPITGVSAGLYFFYLKTNTGIVSGKIIKK